MCTAQASVEMSCSSGTDLSLTPSFQGFSALPHAWADKLPTGLQSTNKLMPALLHGCLQINLKISFTADLFSGLLPWPVCSGKDGKFQAEGKISDLRKDAIWYHI